jgi:hypothetical protein
LSFFKRQVCIAIGGDFYRNIHNPVQKRVRRLLM